MIKSTIKASIIALAFICTQVQSDEHTIVTKPCEADTNTCDGCDFIYTPGHTLNMIIAKRLTGKDCRVDRIVYKLVKKD